MRRRLEVRDLRSLERQSMFSIFHPLDPNHKLPRELLEGGRRYRFLDLPWSGLFSFAYLPALLVVVVMASQGLNPLLAFGMVGLVFAGTIVFVLKARYPLTVE